MRSSVLESLSGTEVCGRCSMKRVLIVDDEADHRLILRTILESEGYTCEEAQDGVAALEWLSKEHMDLVLTDLNMPRINGLELTEEMADRRGLEKIPVILITSQAIEEVSFLARKVKPHAVLAKPCEGKKLLAAVASAIEASKRSIR